MDDYTILRSHISKVIDSFGIVVFVSRFVEMSSKKELVILNGHNYGI
jgi:hypothetical protein